LVINQAVFVALKSKIMTAQDISKAQNYNRRDFKFTADNGKNRCDNEGFISPSRIKEIMTDFGSYQCSSLKYPRFKSHRSNPRSYTEEYLHHLIKY
jgi:adenine-specific DNA methylase